MKKYKIKIIPKSFLLCSNGDTSSTFNTQFVFDENGFPYFPAKTFKGLLRESMTEVLEIENKTEAEIETEIDLYFGKKGSSSNEGILQFDNFYLPNYKIELESIITDNTLSRIQIQRFFTSVIQQTALNDKDIALDGSLRTFSVLNYTSATLFETHIDLEEKTPVLEKALLNLRHAGIGRNRGFGKIKCTIEEDNYSVSETKLLENNEFDSLQIEIITKEPIILGTQTADQNMVNTADFIAGSQILGMFAWNYADPNDDSFREIFLQNHLIFEHCYPVNAEPFPKAIHQEKYLPENSPKFHNILNKSDECVTKEISGFIDTNKQNIRVEKSFSFHASRFKDRSAGRSTEDANEGGIFYYEAINKNQKFVGRILGKKELLTKIIEIKGLEFEASIGKSKTAQYGKVLVSITPIKKENKEITFQNTFYAVAQTPIILLNDSGFPTPTVKILSNELGSDYVIESASSRITFVEHFNAKWHAKTGKYSAFDAGSTFRINLGQKKTMLTERYVGIMNDKGYGKIKFMSEQELNTYMALNDTTVDIQVENSTLLDKIKTIIAKQAYQVDIEIAAYTLAKDSRYKDLTNSLISRMIEVIKSAQNIEDVKKYLEHISENNKSAGVQLKDAYLIEDLETDGGSFETYKLRWVAFFQALRKANKS